MKKIIAGICIFFCMLFALLQFGAFDSTVYGIVQKQGAANGLTIVADGFKFRWNRVGAEKLTVSDAQGVWADVTKLEVSVSFLSAAAGSYKLYSGIAELVKLTARTPVMKKTMSRHFPGIFSVAYAASDNQIPEMMEKIRIESFSINKLEIYAQNELLATGKLEISGKSGQTLNADMENDYGKLAMNASFEKDAVKAELKINQNISAFLADKRYAALIPVKIPDYIQAQLNTELVLTGDYEKISVSCNADINKKIMFSLQGNDLPLSFQFGTLNIECSTDSEGILGLFTDEIRAAEKNMNVRGTLDSLVDITLGNGAPELSGSVKLKELSIKGFSKISVDISAVNADVQFSRESVDIKTFDAALGPNRISASGNIKNYTAIPELDITVHSEKLNLADVLGVLPAGYESMMYGIKPSGGTLKLSSRIGGTTEKPLVNAELRMDNVQLNHSAFSNGLVGLSGLITMKDTAFTADLNAGILQGTMLLKLSGDYSEKNYTADSSVKGISLSQAVQSVNQTDFITAEQKKYISGISGIFDASVHASGNFDTLKESKYELTGHIGSFSHSVNDIQLSGGNFDITAKPLAASVKGALKVIAQGISVDITSDINSDFKDVILKLNGSAAGGTFSADGKVGDFVSAKTLNLHLKTDRISAGVLFPKIKKQKPDLPVDSLSGNISLDINVSGTAGKPVINGKYILENIKTQVPAYLNGEIVLNGTGSIHDRQTDGKFDVKVPGMKSSVSGHAELNETINMDADIQADIAPASILSILSVIPPEYRVYSTAGSIAVNGKISYKTEPKWNITAEFQNLAVSGGELPVGVEKIQGKLMLNQYALSTNGMSASVRGLSLPFEVSSPDILKKQFAFNSSGASLNVSDIVSLVGALNAEYAKSIAPYTFGGKIELKSVVASYSPEAVNASGAIHLNGVSCKTPFLYHPIDRIFGDLNLDSNGISLRELSFSILGSPGVINGTVSKDLKTSLSASVNNIELQKIIDILNMNKTFRATGAVNIVVEGTGTPDSLQSKGELVASSVNITMLPEKPEDKPMNFPASNMRAKLTYNAGKIEFSEISMRMFDGDVTANGALNFSLDPFNYIGNLWIKNADAKRFFEANSHLGNCPSGKVNGSIQRVIGRGGNLDSIEANCFFQVEKSVFQGFPILFKISQYLNAFFKIDIMEIVLSKDAQLDIKFRNGRVLLADVLNQILHQSENVQFEGDGYMKVDTTLGGKIVMKVKKEYLRDGFKLQSEDAKYIRIGIGVSGTLFEPSPNFDDIKKKMINEAVKNVVPGLFNILQKK